MNDADDDLSPETLSLLARGRDAHALPHQRRHGLRRAVLAQAAAGGVMATSATAAAAWTAAAINAASVAVIVVFVGGSIHAVLHGDEPRRPSTPATHTAPAAPTRPAARAAAAPAIPAPVEVSSEGVPATLETIAASVTASPEVRATPSPARSAAPLTRGDFVGATPAPAAPATALAKVTPATLPPASVSDAPAPIIPAPQSASLEVEAQLLRDADRALKSGDATGALRLLDAHAWQFPHGTLEPERSAERVLALCSAGRTADAHQAARDFLASHEAGPLASRVRSSCGGP